MKANTYHILKSDLSGLRIKLLAILDSAGYEALNGHMEWRINDRLEHHSAVTVVAYNTGSVVVSGHGSKYDLASSFAKTYDVGSRRSKNQKQTRRTK